MSKSTTSEKVLGVLLLLYILTYFMAGLVLSLRWETGWIGNALAGSAAIVCLCIVRYFLTYHKPYPSQVSLLGKCFVRAAEELVSTLLVVMLLYLMFCPIYLRESKEFWFMAKVWLSTWLIVLCLRLLVLLLGDNQEDEEDQEDGEDEKGIGEEGIRQLLIARFGPEGLVDMGKNQTGVAEEENPS